MGRVYVVSIISSLVVSVWSCFVYLSLDSMGTKAMEFRQLENVVYTKATAEPAVATTSSDGAAAVTAADRPNNDNNDQTKQQKDKISKTSSITHSDLTLWRDEPDPNKPYLILHFGPGKTGSTTFQSEMTAWKDRVYQLDNLFYAGLQGPAQGVQAQGPAIEEKIQTKFLDARCHEQLAQKRKEWEASSSTLSASSNTLKQALEQVECIQEPLRMLQEHRQNNTSILFSSEVKSLVGAWRTEDKESYPDGPVPVDWKSIAALLSEDWNFLQILGHRPYFDWLASAKTHVSSMGAIWVSQFPSQGGFRFNPLIPPEMLVPEQESLATDFDETKLLDNQGMMPSLLSEEKRRMLKAYLIVGTDPYTDSTTMYLKSKDYIPTKILHLYDPIGVRNNILCNVLPQTPHSCRASKQEYEKMQGSSPQGHANDGTVRGDIVQWYDRLAIAAHEAGLVSSKVSRLRLMEQIARYHELTLKRKMDDLPALCPTKAATYELWNWSWTKEQQLLGNHQANLTFHVQLFRQDLKKRKFCIVHADKLLSQEEWQTFFRQFQIPTNTTTTGNHTTNTAES